MTKAELLERLSWVKQVVEVMSVMKDWSQNDRLRTVGTILAVMCADTQSNEEQVERILLTLMTVTPCLRDGVTERMMDEDYLAQSIRAELAKLGNEGSN
jgi:hypothetical protein